MTRIRIGILGLGAVGGYFGGLLAEHYLNSPEAEIILITRKKTAGIIRKNGLKIISENSEKIIFPETISDDPAIIEALDFLIIAVKSYDLEESLLIYKNSIGQQTIILPLLNGIDAKERINKILPKTEVWDGCVYIVSRLIEPGVIKETGNIRSLHFGSKTASQEKLEMFQTLLKSAGINCFLPDNIEQTVWEKFLFISSIASLTSALNVTIGGILDNEDNRILLKNLLHELKQIADSKNIPLPENIADTIIHRMEKLPYETTSSMHSDFLKGSRTEFFSLTEYVIKLGKSLNIQTPAYNKVAEVLRSKIK